MGTPVEKEEDEAGAVNCLIFWDEEVTSLFFTGKSLMATELGFCEIFGRWNTWCKFRIQDIGSGVGKARYRDGRKKWRFCESHPIFCRQRWAICTLQCLARHNKNRKISSAIKLSFYC